MTLDSILDELQPITGDPIKVCRDESALTNAVYRIDSNESTWSLRINNRYANQLGIDRDRERVIINSIQNRDWSPQIIAQHENYLFTCWSDGHPFKPNTEQDLDQLAEVLTEIQQVELIEPTEPLLITKQLAILMSQVDTLNQNFKTVLADYLESYQEPSKLVLCHHDWHSGNVLVDNQQLVVLDWEYAALGDPIIELACVTQGFDLTKAEQQYLMSRLGITAEKIDTAHCLTQAMSLLWYLVRFPEQDWSGRQQQWMSTWADES